MAKSEDLNGVTLDVFTPHEVKTMLDNGEAVLIDVRTVAEYAYEHVAGALLLPMNDFHPDRLPDQEAKRLIFHCGSGIRSRRVAEVARDAGFTRLAHMDGGFGAWKQSGLSYTTVDPATGGPVTKP